MRARMAGLSFAIGIALTTALAISQTGDQQPKMTPEQAAEMAAVIKAGTPGPQHAKMAASAGNYDIKVKNWHDPSAPPMEETGTAKRTMTLGGRVLVEDMTCTMMGLPFTGRGTFGYDNVTGKHWGTWNDSMSTAVIVSQGTCDAEMKNCDFTGTMNDPVRKTPITLRMVSRWTGPTTEIFEMYMPGPDGKEMKSMEITYTKK